MKRSKPIQPPADAMACAIWACRAVVKLVGSFVTACIVPECPPPLPPRTVLVTGAARHLGRAFSLAFARAGWDVACHYQHSRDASPADPAPRSRRWAARLGRGGTLADTPRSNAFPMAVQALGRWPDAIVNNASLFEADTGVHFHPPATAADASEPGSAAAPGRGATGHLQSAGADRGACAGPKRCSTSTPTIFPTRSPKLALERAVALQAQALAPHVRVCGLAPGLVYVSGPQTGDNFHRAST